MNQEKGISVLIPLFNWPIQPLLEALRKEENTNFKVEIIILDDASTDKELLKTNKIEAEKYHASLIENRVNFGRAKTRNRLAELASFSVLLFIDVDSMPKSPQFLLHYWQAHFKALVVAGGTVYENSPPANSNHILRWAYGKKKEERGIEQRSKEGFQKLSLNNFLIERELYLSIRLNENISKYGHEDTLFGISLEKIAPSLLHIENPVFHTGLDQNQEFLAKTETAIENLFILSQSHPELKSLKLVQISLNHSTSPVGKLFFWLGNRYKKHLLANLQSSQPTVAFLDLLKLWLLLGKFQGKNPSLFS